MKSAEELFSMPHPESRRHKRMSLQNRAAQFAPFAALTGYDAQIAETERTTEPLAIIGEDLIEEISRKLQYLFFSHRELPRAEITYFVPDCRKNGGRYVTARGQILSVQAETQTIFLQDTAISVSDIADITFLDLPFDQA